MYICLAGRGGCRERGFLGPQPCAAGVRGLALKSQGGGPYTTFVLERMQPGAEVYTLKVRLWLNRLASAVKQNQGSS